MVNTNSGDFRCLQKSLKTVWIQIVGPDLDQWCLAQLGRDNVNDTLFEILGAD